MTALVAVRHDQDWVGFAVVMGILLLSLHMWARHRRVDAGADELLFWIRSLGPDVEHDHAACANPDCDQVICRCHKPAECTGTTTLGCEHEGLCWDCRLGCRRCARELAAEQDADWASGR